jgi:hypothetical protein
MRITQVAFRTLRVTKQFENDTAEVVVQLDEHDTAQTALAFARSECLASLALAKDATLEDRLKAKLSTAFGRAKIQAFLDRGYESY